MKRIAVISDLAVFPPNAGNTARIGTLMNNLRRLGHEVWFLGLGLKPREEAAMRDAWGAGFVHVLPHRRLREIKPRRRALRRLILGRFVSRDICRPDVDFWYWPHWDSQIREFAARHQFDAAIAEYVFFSRALENFDGRVLKIIDTHDVFTDRQKKLKARGIKSCYRYLPRKEEARGLARADAVIAIQENEAGFFRGMTPTETPVFTVGHTVDVARPELPRMAGRKGRSTLLFLGTDYSANLDGITYFIDRVLPLVADAVPGSRLLVAGSICRVLKTDSPAVEFLGVVERLEDAYAMADVVINPVLVGTGLKTKSIEALGFGKPLVTTLCGAEGLEKGAGTAFLVAERPEEFAAEVAILLRDTRRAAWLARRARRFAEDWNRRQLETLEAVLALTKQIDEQ